MTYTATAYASPVRTLFDSMLRPSVEEETGHHERHVRSAIHHRVTGEHVVDRLTLGPIASALRAVGRLFARMHHGSVNACAGHIPVMSLVALARGLVVRPWCECAARLEYSDDKNAMKLAYRAPALMASVQIHGWRPFFCWR